MQAWLNMARHEGYLGNESELQGNVAAYYCP
jgi:hypothetical protein